MLVASVTPVGSPEGKIMLIELRRPATVVFWLEPAEPSGGVEWSDTFMIGSMSDRPGIAFEVSPENATLPVTVPSYAAAAHEMRPDALTVRVNVEPDTL